MAKNELVERVLGPAEDRLDLGDLLLSEKPLLLVAADDLVGRLLLHLVNLHQKALHLQVMVPELVGLVSEV